MEENGAFSLFETSVNGNVTFAYIMTFHSTRVCNFCSTFFTQIHWHRCMGFHFNQRRSP